MDSNYIITPSGTFINTNELYHWGIKGMKWGVRRYQNPDGSLTEKGRKRYTNPDGSLNKKGKKKFGNSVNTAESAGSSSKASSGESTSDMADSELQNRVNRLRNEDAYRDLSKKLGYDSPKTELDAKIAEMEKQKRYLELQRDIKNLTPQQVSKGKQVVNTLVDKAIIPAVTGAGKEVLQSYLTNAGMSAVKKALSKTMAQADADVKRAAAKEKAKLDKEAAKDAEKKAKEEAERAKSDAEARRRRQNVRNVWDRMNSNRNQSERSNPSQDEYEFDWDNARPGTVEGQGSSSRRSSNNSQNSSSSNKKSTIDADWFSRVDDTPVTDLTTTRSASSGRTHIFGYLNAPVSSLPSPNIAGYLSAPKDDDD